MVKKATKRELEQVEELRTLYASLDKPPVPMLSDERLLEEVRMANKTKRRLSQTINRF